MDKDMATLSNSPANPLGNNDIVLGYSYSLAPYAGRQHVLTVHELRDMVGAHSLASANADADADAKACAEQVKFLSTSNEQFIDMIFPRIWEEGSYYYGPGGVETPVGFPFAANTMILVFNKRLFEAFRAPIEELLSLSLNEFEGGCHLSWDQFEEVADFFNQQRMERKRNCWGVVMQGAIEGRWLYYEWLNFVYGDGGSVTSKHRGWHRNHKENISIDSADTVRATERYVRMARNSYGEFTKIGHDQQIEAMRKGQVAMAIIWNDRLVENFMGRDFGFRAIPGKCSMIGTGTYFVNRHSPNWLQAAHFIEQTMTIVAHADLMRRGLCSPYKELYEREDLYDPKCPSGMTWIPAVKASLADARPTRMLEAYWDAGLIAKEVMQSLRKLIRTRKGNVQEELLKLKQSFLENQARLHNPDGAV